MSDPNIEYNPHGLPEETVRESNRQHVLAGVMRVGGLSDGEDSEVLASLVHALQVQIDYLSADVTSVRQKFDTEI